MELIINDKFKSLIPPLAKEEYETLKKSILEVGITDDIQVWKEPTPEKLYCKYCYKEVDINYDGNCVECETNLYNISEENYIIIDGHNRYEIAQKHNLNFNVKVLNFDDENDVMLYIIDKQMGRRNINSFVKLELTEKYEGIIKEKAKKNLSLGGKNKPLPILAKVEIDEIEDFLSNEPKTTKDIEPVINWEEVIIKPIDTRKEIAKLAGVSHGTKSKYDFIKDKIDEQTKEKLRSKKITIDKVYKDIKKDKQITELKAKEIKPITDNYDVIVIDPPWQMEKIEREVAPNQIGFDYPTMSDEEIKKFKLPAASNCHIFLWTTHKHLPLAFEVFKSWNVKYVLTMVWHKNGGFQPFGLPQYNNEFILYGRIGTPIFTNTKAFNTCFNADRKGHSVKPEEFYETIRRTTSGKRIDIFNRRKIEGFDTYGNEAN